MTIVEAKEREGRGVLAIRTGLTPRAFAQSKLPRETTSRGLIFEPSGSIRAWIPEGTFSEGSGPEERVWVYGPEFPGQTLLSMLSSDRETAWARLHQAISLIHKAALSGLVTSADLALIAGAGPEALVCGENGSVLALPHGLYTRAIANQGERIAFDNRLRWVHPDRRTISPARAFAFLAGTCAYRIAAGFPAFGEAIAMGENAPAEPSIFVEDAARNIRHSIFEPLSLASWELRPAAASCIDALVSTQLAASADTLLAFGTEYKSLIDPQKEGHPASEAHKAAREASARRRAGLVRRERFIRKYRRAFAIVGAIAVTTGILAGVLISDLRSKPTTIGLSPMEVVSGYYGAIDRLDQEIPKAYRDSAVVIDYENIVTNLYVTSKIRQSYEGEEVIISPATLFALGNPGKRGVYGLTNLSIKENFSSANAAEYSVSLYQWLPESEHPVETAADGTVPAQLSISRRTETMRLEWRKDRWMISAFIPTGRTLITDDATLIFFQIEDGTARAQPWAPTGEEIEAARAKLPKKEH
jgi:hypothetical protein